MSEDTRYPKFDRERLSPHFARHELACRHCAELVLDPLLLVGLEWMRDTLDAPIVVTSGYRCRTHNAAVGGGARSLHLDGRAADITSSAGLRALLDAACRVHYFAHGGIGLYPAQNFIHVDVRDQGSSRWGPDGTYRTYSAALAEIMSTMIA